MQFERMNFESVPQFSFTCDSAALYQIALSSSVSCAGSMILRISSQPVCSVAEQLASRASLTIADGESALSFICKVGCAIGVLPCVEIRLLLVGSIFG